MKIDWLVTDVTAVGSPESATCYFGADVGWAFFLTIQVFLRPGRALRDVGTFLSPNDSKEIHLLKIAWLVTDVTAVGSPDRAERVIWGVDFDWTFRWQI